MNAETFRRLTGIPEGFATDLAVTIRNPRESSTIAEKVSLVLPDTRCILREEIIRTYTALFDWRGGYTVVLLVGAFLAFLIFAWDKATGLSAEERQEIGILKGLGWDTSDILMLKFWEGSVISLTAFLLGVCAAYVHTFMASAPLFEHALKGWATLYPAFRLNPDRGSLPTGGSLFLDRPALFLRLPRSRLEMASKRPGRGHETRITLTGFGFLPIVITVTMGGLTGFWDNIKTVSKEVSSCKSSKD